MDLQRHDVSGTVGAATGAAAGVAVVALAYLLFVEEEETVAYAVLGLAAVVSLFAATHRGWRPAVYGLAAVVMLSIAAFVFVVMTLA